MIVVRMISGPEAAAKSAGVAGWQFTERQGSLIF
jgi:hypothetical protein